MVCPRCNKSHFNTFTINRYNTRMPVNKCRVCGYLWIRDEDLVNLTKAESKKLFIESLMQLGKEQDGKKQGKGNRGKDS